MIMSYILLLIFLYYMFLNSFSFDIVGYTSIAVVSLIVLILTIFRPNLTKVLYVSLILRIIIIFINTYVAPIPNSFGDTTNFQDIAYEWSQYNFIDLVYLFPAFTSNSISWLLAFFYFLFGFSQLLGHSLSLLFGMISIYMVWSVLNKIWGETVANKTIWIFALFPTVVLYSCLILREVYIIFFIIFVLDGIVDWYQKKKIVSLVQIFIGFLFATFFHTAMIFGLVVFFAILLMQTSIILFLNLKNLNLNLKNFLVFLLLMLSILFIYKQDYRFSKIGSLKDIDGKKSLIFKHMKDFSTGDASYPSWTVPKKVDDIYVVGPMRIMYFLFSPFPWDVKKNSHMLGTLDGFFYLYLTFLIIINIKIILSNPILRIIFSIFLVYLVVYGISIGNFGTGIRHRTKLFVILIILVAPFIPKLSFSSKGHHR